MVAAAEAAYYFPDPEIRDRGWLRNGLLYWDRIHTIGPAGRIFHPGPDRDAHLLLDEGVWVMDRVDQSDDAVLQASEHTKALFAQDEGRAALADASGSEEFLFFEKMSPQLRQWILGDENGELVDGGAGTSGLAGGPWGARVPDILATVHVGFIARALAQQRGYGLVTGDQTAYKLAQLPIPELGAELPTNAQVVLLETQIKSLALRPEVGVRDVLDFRDSHRDDLLKLRGRISELTAIPPRFDDSHALRCWANGVASQSLERDLIGLRESLDDELPNALATGLITVGLPVLLAAAGGVAPGVLAAAAGIGISSSTVKYRIRRRRIENACPAIYLERARRKFGSKRP